LFFENEKVLRSNIIHPYLSSHMPAKKKAAKKVAKKAVKKVAKKTVKKVAKKAVKKVAKKKATKKKK
jgi:hypothetical protein